MLLFFIFLTISNASNLDYLDIGLENAKLGEVYYWTSPVVVQLIYEIPALPSMDEFARPRCDYALNARRSLFHRFNKQFSHLTEFPRYKQNCNRFANKTYFESDTEKDCANCFRISSENDPYYLECLTLLQLREICKQGKKMKRNRREIETTREHYMLSSIAVSLAESAKTQDDRISSRFEHEHHLQRENVNFQLLFMNTFRWQLSMSELWFLHYVQSDADLFAKILVHMSGILPETRALTAKKINTSISEDWSVQSTERNQSHVAINVTFTSFNPEYNAELYRFRFFPVKYHEDFFMVNSEDTFALKCNDIVVQVTSFSANHIQENDYITDSPCHQNHVTSELQMCMKSVLNSVPEARKICFRNSKKFPNVNEFYFTIENEIWFPKTLEISFECRSGKSGKKEVQKNSIMNPECQCYYSTVNQAVPQTKTCATKHSFTQIKSNFTLGQLSNSPFFMGTTNEFAKNSTWHSSAVNRMNEKVLLDSEKVKEYFKTKLEKEKSTGASFGWKFKFGLSSLWLLLPVLAVLCLMGVMCFKCKSMTGFGKVPGPMFVTYCQHQEKDNVVLRNSNDNDKSRVLSWPSRSAHGVNV